MPQENHKTLAEKIARILESEPRSVDNTLIQTILDEINARLEKLELALSFSQSSRPYPNLAHPSQDRFAIAEALAEEVFPGPQKERACTFEPTKRCDHCSMCSSRGF